MFSSTTMAASTTIPTANAIPASDTTLSERPSMAMATKEPTTETGIASETIRVGRQDLRNSSSMSAASAPPTTMFCRTSPMADRM